ncbi:MAG TPA: nucleoside triphosphate pyrophosphohydrolase [Negativicutes bacterium]|nr:nucleoside triphosphate pyrophosphohydrolase [Negativicutes bacterium]
MGSITIVGLGPGPFGCMSLETWDIVRQASTLLLRTAIHPTVGELQARGVVFESYDALYEQGTDFDSIYAAIAADVLKRAQQGQSVVFAVPGSPMVAEKTVGLIRIKAQEEQVPVRVLPGMSFFELLCNRLGVDPQQGMTIVDAQEIETLPSDLPTGLVITQVFSPFIASELKLSLMERLQDEAPVIVARHLGLPDESVESVPLFELDRQSGFDHLTSVYVPHGSPRQNTFSLDPVVDVMARLRSPDGCPWDIEQSHATLRRYIIEEVYEVLEAIDEKDPAHLCEELGDLLLQIVFHARMAEENGDFSMQNVVDTVTEKLIRRHPHVFGDISVRDAAEVIVNWDAIKRREKTVKPQSALDGVPKGLPALLRANKLQLKAAKVGFDWDDIAPVWAKVAEELDELREAETSGDKVKIEDELGDVIFAVVNLGRFLGIEAEVALNGTNNKFIRRFQQVETSVRAKGLKWKNLDLTAMDEMWEAAKATEKK